jgi:type III pantothenate kinase
MTQLLLDFGNTRDKFALARGEHLVLTRAAPQRLDQPALLALIEAHQPGSAAVCNTGPDRRDLLDWLGKRLPLLELGPETPLPIRNAYASPETLGPDRLALAVGAWARFPGRPVLAIDAGTCITYELLDAQGTYLGGLIAPGVRMRLQAMHTFTARLPLLSWEPGGSEAGGPQAAGAAGDAQAPTLSEGPHDAAFPPWGNTTASSMLAGSATAACAEIEGMVQRMEQSWPGLAVVLSGGDAGTLAPSLKCRIFAVPNLLMEGLNKILIHSDLVRL